VFSGRAMPHSIADQARLLGARLLVAGIDYRAERRDLDWDLHGLGGSRCALPLPGMRGPVQVDNAAGVLVALDGLRQRLPLDQRAVRTGLLGARVRGRFEVHPGAPTWVLDVAHNPQAAAVLSDTLGQLFCRGRRIAVCAILADKDAGAVAQALAGRFDHWLLAGLEDSGRGQSAARLEARIRAYTGTAVVETSGSVAEAMNQAAALAGDDDQVVVFGSFLTVSAAMDWLESKSHGAGG
jgi:dihydrofolate synthase/folylpolyglutamate synthase